MSLNAATIEVLIAKGLSASDLLEVARATEVKADRTNAERQARHRARKRNAVTVTPPPPNEEDNLNPQTVSEPDGSSTLPRRKSDPFPCPEGVDPVDWDGLKANRRKKRAALSPSAHRGILRKLAQFAVDGWPPGPVVAAAAERGWTTVFETDEMKARQNGQRQPGIGLRGTRPDPALDLYRQGLAEEAAERSAQAPDRGTRASLPALGAG